MVGVALRAALYLADRSLTLDEAFVGLNIERHSVRGLLGQLDWNSAAPIGFLEIEKAMMVALGGAEHVLRAAPFIASVLGLLVFARLANWVAQPRAAPLAVLLFAVLALPIAYAALAKPYSLDVLLVVTLSLATLSALSAEPRSSALIALGVLGALAPVLSYASVFAVAASAAIIHSIVHLREYRRARIWMITVVSGWGALFLAGYLWRGSSIAHLRDSFGGGNEYVGSLPSIRNAIGAVRITLGLSADSTQLGTAFAVTASIIAGVFFVAGAVHLVRR